MNKGKFVKVLNIISDNHYIKTQKKDGYNIYGRKRLIVVLFIPNLNKERKNNYDERNNQKNVKTKSYQ